jgi:hypothetical protein
MDIKYIYALCISARGVGTIVSLPSVVRARDDQSAKDIGMEIARDEWPASSGWSDHQVSIVRIPGEWCIELASWLRKDSIL